MKTFKSILLYVVIFLSLCIFNVEVTACTGITLNSTDGAKVLARTVEWASTPMKCGYIIVPQGYIHQSLTPTGVDGMKFKSAYGYTAFYTEYENFVVDGINESGLSAGLFFFPGYGGYEEYDESLKATTLCDFQFVSWVLSRFDNIDDIISAVQDIHLVGLDPRVGTVHWRISEPSGRTVVLEYVAGKPHFYENKLGVLTNAPGFEWHMTNLNNYVNLRNGSASSISYNGVEIKPFGGGSALLGLPGDFTPPSRFIRAAFMQMSTPPLNTASDAVLQCFRILNSFDIPIGMAHSDTVPENLPGATQITVVTDQKNKKLYFRTVWNSNIRCINTSDINYKKIKYQVHQLDEDKTQPIEYLIIL